ncbi:MAG TPA: hypothetical protein ENJ26_01660 [Rhodobacteraceae bacterium]|nr:hypothetical protein [Paracoccaceae bacterium]
MSDFVVRKTRLVAGTWEGVVRTGSGAAEPPGIVVTHLETPLEHELTADPEAEGQWLLRVPLPVELLNDGVQVFLVQDQKNGEVLASFTLITGEPLEEDIRAEIELLRAELDMLKKAFRRHCLEAHE